MPCDLKQCSNQDPTFEYDDIVEVKTVWPKRKVNRESFHINWVANGEAKFHNKCWEKILTGVRKRASAKQIDLKFTTQERTLIKEAEKTAEFTNSQRTICVEAERVASLIQSSSHCVAFTGAGISTSAGIGDYRGKSGKWTEMDQKEIDVENLFSDKIEHSPRKKPKAEEGMSETEEDNDDGVPYESLRPTYTHEALHKLLTEGYLKYIISQNGDGLHGLSGIPPENMSELHGNVFLEICEKCKREYYRPYYVMDDAGSEYYEELEDHGKTDIIKPKYAVKCKRCGLSHRTRRKCESKGCSGYLKDSIINFHDLLDDKIFQKAEENSEACDLILCLGSTLTVTPASFLIEKIKEPKRYVICNRQTTDKDDACLTRDKDDNKLGSRIFGDCDTFFKEVMKNILSTDELQMWENGRSERMKMYDSQRTVI